MTTELQDFAKSVIADLRRELPEFEQLATKSKDDAFTAARVIGAVTLRAMTGGTLPEDSRTIMGARSIIQDIKVEGQITFQAAFERSVMNVLGHGLKLVRGLLGLP